MNNIIENSQKWLKNKSEIGFGAKVAFEEDGVHIAINNTPRKYLKAIQRLGEAIVLDGLKTLSEVFAYPVAAKDAETESARVKAFLMTRREPLLNLLLTDGFDAFYEAASMDARVMRTQYIIYSFAFTEGEGWKGWNGMPPTIEMLEYIESSIECAQKVV